MRVETLAPDPRLSHLVQSHQSRTASLRGDPLRLPLPARTDVLIEFYFTRPHLVEHRTTGRRERTDWAVAVGPQSFQAATLLLAGEIEVFTTRLRATALHALFGAPMPHLANGAVALESLMGPRPARELHERLAEAETVRARARIMDQTLLSLAPPPRLDAIALAAERLQRDGGAGSIEELAQAADLSPRQFRRRFIASVGVAPKLYGRVARLTAALEAKAAAPQTSWTEIAHAFGWFDQAHLDKDFRALAGTSPSAFAQDRPVPTKMSVPY